MSQKSNGDEPVYTSSRKRRVRRYGLEMPPNRSATVDFHGFRRYEATRQEANNAMMALLAGSQLAVHTLQLTNGSQHLLPEIFPGVDHIRYFNLRTDSASAILQDTGHHLGAVAVPYALAVHEDFVQTTIQFLQEFGFIRKAPGSRAETSNAVKAWNMHEAVFLTLGSTPPPRGAGGYALENFHLLREMRNSHIHNGGEVSQQLSDEVTLSSSEAISNWVRLTLRTPAEMISKGEVRFTIQDIFASFAITKALGLTLNNLLRDSVRKDQWADTSVADYSKLSSHPVRSNQWMQGLLSFATMRYGASGISSEDIVDAAIRSGKWVEGISILPRRTVRLANQPRNLGSRYPGKS